MCLSKVSWTAWLTRDCCNGPWAVIKIPCGTCNTRWCTASWSGCRQFWVFVRGISAKSSSARFGTYCVSAGRCWTAYCGWGYASRAAAFLCIPTSRPMLLPLSSSSRHCGVCGRWPSGTTSRWLSLSRTCRRFLVSRVPGLHSIVAFVRAKPHFSKDHISGWEKIDDDVLRLFVITALSAAPADSTLNLLVKGDRLPLVLPDLDTEVQSALQQIHTLLPEVWSVFAGIPWVCSYKACDLVQSAQLWRPHVSPCGACIELDCRVSPSVVIIKQRSWRLSALPLGRMVPSPIGYMTCSSSASQ